MRPLRYVIPLLALLLVVGGFAMANGTQEKTGTKTATATQPTVASSGKYKEAPMLDALVAQGKLPPVAQRLPENPKVEPMIDQIGKYGGSITVYATTNGIFDDFQGMWGAALYRIPQSGVGIEPDLAAGYSINKAKTEFTVKLRKGLKWSDGHPFTSEDIKFMYMDMIHNPNVKTWNSLPQVMNVLTPDPLTAVLVAPDGLGTLPLEIAGWQGGRSQSFQPSFYLKKWDPKYNPDANKLAKQEGFDNWYDCMYSHYWWSPETDLNLPLVTPWVLTKRSTTLKVYQRNPYFWRVDPNGDQLPYLDGYVVSIVNPETYQLKVSGGEAAIAYTHTTMDNLSLYKTNAQTGDYNVVLFPGMYSSDYTLDVCQLYTKSPAVKAILRNVKFRQAVSVAINRQDINNTLFYGLGTPSQASPLKSASFYEKGWSSYYAQYDPKLANSLLDQIGMNKRDKQGYRLMPDGKPFPLVIEYAAARNTPCLELIQQYLKAVGLNTTIKMEAEGLMDQRLTAGDIMMWMEDSPGPPSDERDAFEHLWQWRSEVNVQWVNWWAEKAAAVRKMTGKTVLPDNWPFLKTPGESKLIGADIPDSWKQYEIDATAFRAAPIGSPQYIAAGHKVFNFFVHNLFKIGTVGQAPAVMVVSKKLGNVMKPGWVKGVPLGAQLIQEWQDQVYLK